ncbi:HTH-type transcriptional regulator Hpr [Fictibacillus barbaricus]|uniref:MarR family protease production transcriptional regulator HPr n=1 Tax=Fictibacillus barbaricus TaxID=182136 RepID=A0ABU1TVA8_9BACL|nr:HTH-type transcriptional regulator Hpr [Fictibacillus barbaricus]MDR7071146.1 MarR family protease production transcriptional regulator HPr [Fictibacillus barbaricus]
MNKDQLYSFKEAMIYSHKLAQISKALWKSVEKDWQNWVKDYGLNINEHHILWIAHHLEGASISDIAKFGVMHVSTAFNFSKKLEEQGYLTFSKKENDKRNTYICLTQKGEELLLQTLSTYDPAKFGVFSASMPIKDLFGNFPEFPELMSIIRNLYGDDFMSIFSKLEDKIETTMNEQQKSAPIMAVEEIASSHS